MPSLTRFVVGNIPSKFSVPIVLLLSASVGVHGQVSGMTDTRRQRVVDEHNRLRRTVSAVAMIKMEYDMRLECVARKFAEASGTFKGHNANRVSDYQACGGSGYVGENWFSGAPEEAAFYWVDFEWAYSGFNGCSERQNYVWETKDTKANASPPKGSTDFSKCSGGMTGHYTQVMWANSYAVGCWYTPTFGTVCNYAPGGNYVGQSYVIYGTKCSKCPAGFTVCDNGLCARTGSITGTTTAPTTTRPPTTTTRPPITTTTTRTTTNQITTITSLITVIQTTTFTPPPRTITSVVTITPPTTTSTRTFRTTFYPSTCPIPTTIYTMGQFTTLTQTTTIRQVPCDERNTTNIYAYPMVGNNPPMVMGKLAKDNAAS